MPAQPAHLAVDSGQNVLLCVLYARGLRLPRQPRAWADLFVLGITGLIVPYVLITWGEQYMASGMAAILNATTPLFAVLLTHVWTREEHLNGVKLLGVATGFVGVVVAVGLAAPAVFSAGSPGGGALAWPQAGVLVAALSYAIAGSYGRRAFRGVPALIPAAGQLLTGSLIITPIALVLHGVPDPLPSARAVAAVLALAILGTALAYVLLYWLMDRIGAARTSMVTYLLPPFALGYGAVFLGETITVLHCSASGCSW